MRQGLAPSSWLFAVLARGTAACGSHNLDWEASNTGHDYSSKRVSFLVAFRDALHSRLAEFLARP